MRIIYQFKVVYWSQNEPKELGGLFFEEIIEYIDCLRVSWTKFEQFRVYYSTKADFSY